MPTIPRLRDKKRPQSYRKRQRQSMYSKSEYRKLRDWYYQCHPICEDCQRIGLLTEAKDIHHVMSPYDPNISPAESYRRLMDENNLVSLCRYHHNLRHGNCKKEEIDEFNKALSNINTNHADADIMPYNEDSSSTSASTSNKD